MLDINTLLKTALKEKNQVELQVLRSIKTEFTKYVTAKSGNELTDAVEATILNKMKNQRLDSIMAYQKAGRQDLVDSETVELNTLLKFVPKEASEEEINIGIDNAITKLLSEKGDGYVLSMRDMKFITSEVKGKYPSADGKTIANIFKEKL